jgi:hypothetical protein
MYEYLLRDVPPHLQHLVQRATTVQYCSCTEFHLYNTGYRLSSLQIPVTLHGVLTYNTVFYSLLTYNTCYSMSSLTLTVTGCPHLQDIHIDFEYLIQGAHT